jgi:hypothetical protein
MGVHRYDIPVPGTPGLFEERYWSPVNVPVAGCDGAVRWILHQVEDVTAVRVDLMRALEFYRGELADDHGNDTNRARRSTEYAAVSLSNAGLVAEAEQMRRAKVPPAVIEHAKGIVMAELRCGPDDAFTVLVHLSQDANRKLRDIVAAAYSSHGAAPDGE